MAKVHLFQSKVPAIDFELEYSYLEEINEDNK